MSNSFSQTATLTCPQCSTEFQDDVWLVVDPQEQPELLDKVLAGNLHILPCPQCDFQGGVDAPILLYRAEENPILIFSSADGTSQEEDREHVGGLLGHLRQELGESWQDSWATQMASVPRWLLPVFLTEGADAALRLAQEEAEIELTEMKQNDPHAYQNLEKELGQETEMPPLLQVIQNFLFARSWEESQQTVIQHPELLEDETDEVLSQLITAAEEESEIDTSQMFADHRELLRRCRDVGVEAAFSEKGR
jgi:isopentenyldiphosphate isomerase